MLSDPLRIANDTIHLVNTKYPSTSTTKISRMMKHLCDKNNVSINLCNNISWCDSYIKKYATNDKKEVMKILRWFTLFVDKVEGLREEYWVFKSNLLDTINGIFNMVNDKLVANCEEVAKITAMLLKIKGLKNVYTAALKAGVLPVDHVVTVFNKDDSEFTGEIINNKTVIVDSWLGIADYAGNYFSKHKGQCGNFVRIPEGKMGLRNIHNYNLSDAQIEELMSKYSKTLNKINNN